MGIVALSREGEEERTNGSRGRGGVEPLVGRRQGTAAIKTRRVCMVWNVPCS
jgi:hypothetical protein